ncbi:hypothetical protein RJ639_039482 [Escallonia herrerae]|uniref:Alliinase C-terminal domain-containing protein n=1 Tax=Escallonia herrerae TaxID=1293975 RepID=A0AA89B3J9_9ASTE|nr:hypothetical protein RJ639_039482 [Escallonia herrerae]
MCGTEEARVIRSSPSPTASDAIINLEQGSSCCGGDRVESANSGCVVRSLSLSDKPESVSVVSAAPYYSSYPEVTDFLRSGLYKWAGDAHIFDADGPYIELVTSPNNPDGMMREAVVVNRPGQGKLVHDLAYYWPQYTSISRAVDFDVMLFTASKCTGHAGSRFGKTLMAERWDKLREVVKRSNIFSLPKYPNQYCLFTGDFSEAHPAFAWMECNEIIEDCEKFLREHKIVTRSGRRFGTDPKHVRISMVSRDEEFNLFLHRLSTIQWRDIPTEENMSSSRSALASKEEARDMISARTVSSDGFINLDHGDPTMFESYWRKMGDKCTVVIAGSDSLSYFAETKNLCWFLEPKLEEAIKGLHRAVGNAAADDHHVVVGTGSSQLILAALYALCPQDELKPVSVVSAVPYYSSYPEMTDFLRSGLYKWAGDAQTLDTDGPYIELVTSPNNPDGVTREAIVVNRGRGKLVHDLAYYWPQYTPISHPADYDVMLFTASKCTGHAGSRIGWALVRDKDVARKITKFIELSTIGVSKESQLRAAKVLGAISDSCQRSGPLEFDNFFECSKNLLAERWDKLRDVVKRSDIFSLPEYPLQHCLFTGEFTVAHPGNSSIMLKAITMNTLVVSLNRADPRPVCLMLVSFYEKNAAFAWMKCNESIEDCEKFLKEYKIQTRSGKRFGTDPKYVRFSMVSRDKEFNLLLQRLLAIQGRD